MNFLSERNIEMHREYLNDLILRYSIFEKSYSDLRGKSIDAVYRMNLKRSEREEAVKLLIEISAHKIFFSSFGRENQKNEKIRRDYGSESQFLYEIGRKAIECESGFLLVYDNRGITEYYCGREYERILRTKNVKLAIDLYEHSYFYDYGFDRKKYVFSALSYFNIGKL